MRPPLQAETASHFLSPQIAEGLLFHGKGDLASAARSYRDSLNENPRNPEALLLLGILARQTGQFAKSAMLIEAAISLHPTPQGYLNLAHALRAAGNLAEAEQACHAAIDAAPTDAALRCWLAEILLERREYTAARRAYEDALKLHIDFARAHHGLGNVLCREGRFAEAVNCYRRAIALAPRQAEFHFGMGYALQRVGNLRGARASLTRAIALRPGFAEAHLNLGNLLYDRGLLPMAASHYRLALRRQPGYVKALINLGNALSRMNHIEEAIACYHQALKLKPDSQTAEHGLGNALAAKKEWNEAQRHLESALALAPASCEIRNSLGNLSYERKHMDAAAEHYRHAIEIDSGYALAHINLGNALLALGKQDQAQEFYERGLKLDTSSAGALYNLALAQLRNGEFTDGWRNYESRWNFEELRLRRRGFQAPLWNGEPLEGRTILLHAEQGLGDTIQFVRFVPLVAARGGRVILEVQPPLLRLMRQIQEVDCIIQRGEPLPPFDWQCPLMSLPLALGITANTIPSPKGYLTIEPDEKYATSAQRLRLGIAWQGNLRNKGDANRSMPLEALRLLAEIPGLTLLSLQKGPGSEQIAFLKDSLPVEDAASRHSDMLETAALIRSLDLVLSVDTSIAHLAGAMGVPVWVMLPWVADWRWMEKRSDTPWYQSARLFRQSSTGDWASVVSQIVDALKSDRRYHPQ